MMIITVSVDWSLVIVLRMANWQGSGGYGMAFTEDDQDDQNHFYSASTAGFDGKAFNFLCQCLGRGGWLSK